MKYIIPFNEIASVSMTAFDSANLIFNELNNSIIPYKNKKLSKELLLILNDTQFNINLMCNLVTKDVIKFNGGYITAIFKSNGKNGVYKTNKNNIINLNFTIFKSYTYNDIMEYMDRIKSSIIGLIAHEIKHTEDYSINQTFEQYMDNRIYIELFNLKDIQSNDIISDMMLCGYITNYEESHVFSTEMYSILKSCGRYNNNTNYILIKLYKDYAYETFLNELKKKRINEPVIYLNKLYRDKIKPFIIERASVYIKIFSDDTNIILDNYVTELNKMNGEIYFKRLIKRLNYRCNKMYRKVSKITSI